MRRPVIVLLYGKSATGKTVLARRLSKDLAMPHLGLDDIKEVLYDNGLLAAADESFANEVAFAAAVDIARRCVRNGVSIVFDLHIKEDLTILRDAMAQHAKLIAVKLVCSKSVRFKRYNQRIRSGSRHPDHCDVLKCPDDVDGEYNDPFDQWPGRLIINTDNLGESEYRQLAAIIMDAASRNSLSGARVV